MPEVLFVCTANQCRSPMASVLFQHLVSKHPNCGEWRIESAGTWALEGHPATERAQYVIKLHGLDLSQHHSRGVTAEMLLSFNLILTMESGHKEALRSEFPKIANRIFLLSEMNGGIFDIHDPIGGSVDDYEATAREIENILDQGFEKIIQIAQESEAQPASIHKSVIDNQ